MTLTECTRFAQGQQKLTVLSLPQIQVKQIFVKVCTSLYCNSAIKPVSLPEQYCYNDSRYFPLLDILMLLPPQKKNLFKIAMSKFLKHENRQKLAIDSEYKASWHDFPSIDSLLAQVSSGKFHNGRDNLVWVFFCCFNPLVSKQINVIKIINLYRFHLPQRQLITTLKAPMEILARVRVIFVLL